MKTLKILFAFILFSGFVSSCTPTSLNEEKSSNAIEIVAGDDDETEIDDTKD